MADLQDKISRNIREFDIIALLDILTYLGYNSEQILFKSNMTYATATSLIESIEFLSEPRQVNIYINMGLLSALSPLPSYFMKIIESGSIDEDSFIKFLGFFNHKLIENYFLSIYPEHDSFLYSDWEKDKSFYLKLLGLNSVTFLHWIFKLIFPELGLCVDRCQHKQELKGDGIRLGKTKIGDTGAFGGKATVAIDGFDVKLYCEEEHMDSGAPWATEVQKRLTSLIFPVLGDYTLSLKVFLIILSQKSCVQLKKESYLGVDRIRGGKEQPRQILIFKGLVPSKIGTGHK